MNILKDLFYTNRKVLLKTIGTFLKCNELLIIGIPYLVVAMITFQITSRMTFLAGIILTAVMSALISDLLYVIETVLKTNKFSWNAFKVGYKVYFRNIFGTVFVFYLVNYGIELFIRPILSFLPLGGLIILTLKLILLILFNPLPEVFYQKKYQELDSLNYSFEFVKKNPFSWFVPNIFIFSIIYFFYKYLINFLGSLLLGVNISVVFALTSVVVLFVNQLFVGFFMIYRGYLFNILDHSTRKKRLFKRHM
ncbi:MAG: hypothetical protein ACQEQE_09455 [Bacillota bacterium]